MEAIIKDLNPIHWTQMHFVQINHFSSENYIFLNFFSQSGLCWPLCLSFKLILFDFSMHVSNANLNTFTWI